MKNILIVCISFLLFSSTANAQAQRGQKALNVWYNYAMPFGDLKNYFSPNGSPRAATVEMMWHLNPALQLGISGGFVNFYEKRPRTVYTLENGSEVSAVLSDNIQVIPIMLSGVYYPMASGQGEVKTIQPFVQLGAGVALLDHQRYLGQFTSASMSKGRFGAKAGAGLKVPFGSFKQHGILAGVHYNYTGFNSLNVKSLNYLTGGIGVSFGLFD